MIDMLSLELSVVRVNRSGQPIIRTRKDALKLAKTLLEKKEILLQILFTFEMLYSEGRSHRGGGIPKRNHRDEVIIFKRAIFQF